MHSEWVRTWKENIITYFKAVSRYLPEENEVNREICTIMIVGKLTEINLLT
jgi:hypothetical protein